MSKTSRYSMFFGTEGIHGGNVRAGAGVEFDLRLGDAKKTERVSRGEGARFRGGEDVVGRGGDPRRIFVDCAQGAERQNGGHRGQSTAGVPVLPSNCSGVTPRKEKRRRMVSSIRLLGQEAPAVIPTVMSPEGSQLSASIS